MGDQVYQLSGEVTLPVEPSGNMSNGWVAGTWVRIVATPASNYSRAVCRVERTDETGRNLGFMLYGPQHKQPVEQLSDMWDTNGRPGGDTHKDWTAKDAGIQYSFDKQGLLQSAGTRVAVACIASEGIFKVYWFEKLNKAKRHNPVLGAPLVYTPGADLYISENGLFTSEKETPAHAWNGYCLFKTSHDDEGDYIILGQSV